MSVTEVKIKGVGASGSARGTERGGEAFAFRSTYLVTVNDVMDTPPVVLAHFKNDSTLPWMGRSFSLGNGFASSSNCIAVNADYIENSDGKYIVTCDFEDGSIGGGDKPNISLVPGRDNAGKITTNPLQWHPDIETTWTQISVAVERAEFLGFDPPIDNPHLRPGRIGPCVNSALVGFDPPPEEDIDIKVIRITNYVPDYRGPVYDRFQGTLNKDATRISKAFAGFTEFLKPYQGRMKFYGSSLADDNGKLYYREQIEVWKHPTSWIREFVDRGIERRALGGDPDGEGGTIAEGSILAGQPALAIIKDSAGYPITEPILFNGNGQPKESPTRPPIFLRYRTRPAVEWMGILW